MVIGVRKIVDAWDCSKKGDFILTLNESLPHGLFKKCRIASNEYPLVPVHLRGVTPAVLMKHIGIKAITGENFVGKEIEFIKEQQ